MATKILTVQYSSLGVPVEGLIPTITVRELTIATSTIVATGVATDIGGGWYRYNFTSYDSTKSYVFTFDGGDSLSDCERYQHGGNESYRDDITEGVWDEDLASHTITGSTGDTLTKIKADTASIMVTEATIVTLIDTLLKYQRNRTKIDVANAQLLIFDDDCTTILTTFNLKDFNGMPSVAEVCERVPTTC
jgi:hypothetical protein